MRQLKKSGASLITHSILLICLLLSPAALLAQDDAGEQSAQARGPETSSPFSIKSRSKFGCAEVDEIKIGGLASHEITVDPRKVERCLREKVGTRFHECKRLRIEEATADWYGVVTLDTKDGPVKFWFEEYDADGSGDPKKVMVWTWPDTEKKYICAAITSRR